MEPLHIEIPTLFSEQHDFHRLAILCKQIMDTTATEIIVRFDRCTFLKANAVACIAAALQYARYHGKTVHIEHSSMQEPVYRASCNYKMLQHFGAQINSGSANTIELRQFRLADEDLVNYLFTRVAKHRFFPKISDTLRRALCNRLIEIYVNAFAHSHSPIGTFSCGQGYPRWWRSFQLTVVDLGIGIPANVREFFA